MNCGRSNLPLGTKVTIKASNNIELDKQFFNLTGVAVHPFNRGCKDVNWVGVVLDTETIWGTKFNFHVDELIYEDISSQV